MSAPRSQREMILAGAERLPEPFRSAMIAGATGKRFSSVRAGLQLAALVKAQIVNTAAPPKRGRKKSVAASD
jgi:hypothetical protein